MAMRVDQLSLLDWKRRIFALYAEVRADADSERAWQQWCTLRDALYRTHPQSPRPGGVPSYFPYDPSLRFDARVDPVEAAMLEIPGSAGSVTRFRRFAVAQFGDPSRKAKRCEGLNRRDRPARARPDQARRQQAREARIP